ncbi:hypothetical protein ACFL6U_22900 [Planctomycetota bacterium]
MIRSLKHRLTLWYGLVLTVLFLTAFVLIDKDLQTYLVEVTDNHIAEKARRNNWYDQNVSTDKIAKTFHVSQTVEGIGKVFYQLYASDGEVLAQSDDSQWQGLNVDLDKVREIAKIPTVKTKKKWKLPTGDMTLRFLGSKTGL